MGKKRKKIKEGRREIVNRQQTDKRKKKTMAIPALMRSQSS